MYDFIIVTESLYCKTMFKCSKYIFIIQLDTNCISRRLHAFAFANFYIVIDAIVILKLIAMLLLVFLIDFILQSTYFQFAVFHTLVCYIYNHCIFNIFRIKNLCSSSCGVFRCRASFLCNICIEQMCNITRYLLATVCAVRCSNCFVCHWIFI